MEATAEVKSIFSWTNIILCSLLAYLVYARIFKKSIAPTFQKPIEPLPVQDYTPRELLKYNGVEDQHILLALKGKVYDVTAGHMFYGPKGPYKNFGGRDASRALASGSFDEDMFTDVDGPIDTLSDLTDEQREAMDDWVNHFESKYIVAGSLKNTK